MRETSRSCPECGAERLFQTRHDVPGTCPDSPDGECPERFCVSCGAALLAEFVVDRADEDLMSRSAGRVA